MSWKTIGAEALKVLKIHLFTIGTTKITVATILTAVVIVLVTFLLSHWAQKGVARLLQRRGVDRQGTVHTVQRLTHYFILLGGLVSALQTFGIDLSTLFAAGAVFAVGLGFAMQTIAQNFVAGLILLVDRSITAGDVLEVEGRVVKVERLGIRSTVARTRDEEQLIIPNATLVQGTVKNYTMSDSRYLMRASVGVVYSSDMGEVSKVLLDAAKGVPWRLDEPAPRILMKEFGDSSVNFEVLVYIDDPWAARRLGAELNERIWWALKEAGIVIAFPQLDLHFDPPVEQSLRLVAGLGPGA